MDELHHRGQLEMMRALVAQGLGSEQHQHRAQPLAAAVDDVFRHLAHQIHLGMQPGTDDPVQLDKVICEERGERIDGHFGRVGEPPSLMVMGQRPVRSGRR